MQTILEHCDCLFYSASSNVYFTKKESFSTAEHDVLMCREILAVNPFTGTKKELFKERLSGMRLWITS